MTDDKEAIPLASKRITLDVVPGAAMRDAGVLWAVNFFVLWPLGLTLSMTINTDGVASDIAFRQWTYPEGELVETINQTEDENTRSFRQFLGFVRERVLSMKPDERAALLQAYSRHGVAEAVQILMVEP